MSKPFKIKDNAKISSEVDILLDNGFTPSAVVYFLKMHYGVTVSIATLYRYKKIFYKPEAHKKILEGIIFKNYGRFIDVIGLKVALVNIFKERIENLLKEGENGPKLFETLDTSITKLNLILNELYGMYQDMGLQPIRSEKISFDATVSDKGDSDCKLETMLAGLSNTQKSEFSKNISEMLNKIKNNYKGDNNYGSYVKFSDKRD